MHGSIINAGSKIGDHNILNSKSLIEHDVEIGNFCHLATGTIINGHCKINDDTFIGSGSVLKQGIIIKKKSLIAMSSIIKHSN